MIGKLESLLLICNIFILYIIKLEHYNVKNLLRKHIIFNSFNKNQNRIYYKSFVYLVFILRFLNYKEK